MPKSIRSRTAAPPCLVTVWFNWIWPWISFWALRFILVEFNSMELLGAPGPGLPSHQGPWGASRKKLFGTSKSGVP